jgi:hypothetical protein
MVASCDFSSRSATSLGIFSTDSYRLHVACTSSWSRRSSFACPFALNDVFIIASAFVATSLSDIIVAQPAISATTTAAPACSGCPGHGVIA